MNLQNEHEISSKSRRQVIAAGLATIGGAFLASSVRANDPASTESKSSFFINLGDFAKGDGSDETDAIQRAIDSIPPIDGSRKEDVCTNHPGGVLFIPRPKVCYAISKTLRFVERANVLVQCESPVFGTRNYPINHYFRWIGPDGGTMFEIRSCMGMWIQNLSMTGLDENALSNFDKGLGLGPPPGRLTHGVVGLRIGPEATSAGFAHALTFDQLRISEVAVGIQLGGVANNGPDITDITFRDTALSFSSVGIHVNSGNLAACTFETMHTNGMRGAKSTIQVDGGEILVLNWASNSPVNPPPSGPDVQINAGGIQVIKAWSEWQGPFLKAGPRAPEWTVGSYGSANYPVILQGVRHGAGPFFEQKTLKSLVPISIDYDNTVPLHLIGCTLFGEVRLGPMSEQTAIDCGTIFIDKDCRGFTGEGAERYGRVIHIGTRHPQNARILEPYVVDRANARGDSSPKSGVWKKGDRVNNIDPDPAKPEKAWCGWICIKEGEPGEWVPFGALGKSAG